MFFISIVKIDRNLISILVGCVLCFLDRLINYYYEALIFENSILTDIIVSISYIFTFIPLVIIKFRSKITKIDNKEIIEDNKLNYIYTKAKIKIIKGKRILILLSAIIIFIQSILFMFSFQIKTNAWIVEILFTSIFYYLIFNQKLYKHHYLSVVLIILLGLIINLVLGNLQKDISENLLYLLIRLLREILISLNDVIDKYIIEKKFVSIYEISFFVGLIDLILLSIFAVLDYYFFGINNFEKYFNNFHFEELLVILGIMITQLGIYISILYTNKNYTPCHIFIIFVVGNIAHCLDFSRNSIIVLICLIFILFFALIFNEIIEIIFLGLSDNTKRNIRNRAESEDIENISILTTDTLTEMEEKTIDLNESEIYK